MEFCPTCGMLLKYELPHDMFRTARFFCPKCPYVSWIESKVMIKRKQCLVKTAVDPIITKDNMRNAPKTDQEMGLLKYIEMKGVGYEGVQNRVQPRIQGEVNSGGGDVVICSNGSSGKRRRGRKIAFSESGQSSSNEAGQTSTNQKHVHESDLHVLDRVGCVAQLVTSCYERKANTEARLCDRASRFRLRTTVQSAENAKLANKARKLKKLLKTALDNGKEAIQMLAKNAIEHAKLVEALKKELKDARSESEEKLKQATKELKLERKMVEKLNGELELEKDGWRQECVSFEKSIERVASECRWLIEEGFGYVINRLHTSQEYLKLLGAAQSNLWESGAHYGLVERCRFGGCLFL